MFFVCVCVCVCVCMSKRSNCVSFMQSNFFKKLSLLCSCKRKANQSEDVHKILGFILDCLSRPTVIPSKLLSLIVVEWSKTNASLHPDLQRTLCSVLSASPLLGLPQVLRWSRSELIQYQSLGRYALQVHLCSVSPRKKIKGGRRGSL